MYGKEISKELRRSAGNFNAAGIKNPGPDWPALFQ